MSDQQTDGRETRYGGFLRRVVIVGAVASVFVFVSLIVIFAIDIILLLFAGLLFGRFLAGLSGLLTSRTRLPHGAALAIVTITLFLLVAGSFAYLVPKISGQVVQLSDELTTASKHLIEQIKESEFVDKLNANTSDPSEWLPANFDAMATIGGIFSTTTGAITGFALIVFVGIYTAADPTLYAKGVLSLVPPKRRERADEVMNKVGDTLWWWIIGRLASMTIIGVLVTLGLWLLGIPVPLALGILAALLTFIPNLGPLIALVPPTLLALQDGWFWAGVVVAFYLAVQAVESYVLTPMIQQRSVSLPPVVTLSTQVLLGFFTGIIGLTVASPLAAVAMVLVRELYVKDVLEATADAGGESDESSEATSSAIDRTLKA